LAVSPGPEALAVAETVTPGPRGRSPVFYVFEHVAARWICKIGGGEGGVAWAVEAARSPGRRPEHAGGAEERAVK
jgi:hypothetical protein